MIKNKVVVFNECGARILINPENIEQYNTMTNCVVNPDLSVVQGEKLENWKLEDNKIVPLSSDEKLDRKNLLQENVCSYNTIVLHKHTFVDVPVDKIVEIIKEIPVEVIKHIEIPVEKEVIKLVEVVKEIQVEVEKIVYKEIEKLKEIKSVPKWCYILMALEALAILVLMIK